MPQWASQICQFITLFCFFAVTFFAGGAHASTPRRGAIGGLEGSAITKRVVSQTTWENRVNKGRYLNCLFPLDAIAARNIGAPQSEYTTHAQAEEFGWWHPDTHANMPGMTMIEGAADHWNIDLSADATEYCGWLHFNDYDHPQAGPDTEVRVLAPGL